MALILEGVSYAYAAGTALAQEALRGVSLSVASGGLVLVLGPSGSGKTTLLRPAGGPSASPSSVRRRSSSPPRCATT
jgi:ABC-type lipoprotein export system ATPase subunit